MDTSIRNIELFSYDLTYVDGDYVMSGNRVIRSLSSTVVRVTTGAGIVGYGETCPLGSNYLPAHAAGARAALAELSPHLIGADAANAAAVNRIMDGALSGHPYAKSAMDIACWDVAGKAVGRPVCDLIGGRQQDQLPLYVAISLDTPEKMSSSVRRHRDAGIHHFQLKLGGDPLEDAERARAVVEATEHGDLVSGDANGGWSLSEAIAAARGMAELPRFFLEQPCATIEECVRVRQSCGLPMILDEVIVDVQSLLRAWELRALEGFNLKLNRVGGLTRGRLLRDLAQAMGLMVNIEDSWGGDLATAAVSHLAASTEKGALAFVPFMNDWTNEHVAEYQPRSVDGLGPVPEAPGLGIEVDAGMLGRPFAICGSDHDSQPT